MITLDQLMELVKEVEITDPIDWSDLNISEDDANKLVGMGVLRLYNTEWSHLTPEMRDVSMLVTITKLLVENFALNIKNQEK